MRKLFLNGCAVATLVGLITPSLAQEMSLGGTMAATGIASGMNATAGTSVTAGAATRNVGRATGDLTDEAGSPNAGGRGGGAAAAGGGGGGGGGSAPRGPLRWTPETGNDLINQLMSGRGSTTNVRSRSRRGKRVRLTRKQRLRLLRAARSRRYTAPGWVVHYLPDDRYKITSGVWQFVSTEADQFYYRPWAPGVLRQSANKVIGFHTWQDAMIAGYRPDPTSKPTPGAQLANLARWTRGPHFQEFVEYIYAGQMTPETFAANYDYAAKVAAAVNSKPYTRPYMGETIDQVLAAVLGEGSLPTTAGPALAAAPPVTGDVTNTRPSMPNPNTPGAVGGPSAGGPAGSADKREEDFNKFRNRAGNISSTNKGP